MLKMRKTMVSWQAFPSLLPRAPLSFLARLKLPFPKLPFPKLPFPSLSNAFPFKRLPRRLKNFENRQKHQRRRSAWVGQVDFGKLELNNRNHNGNCQRLSGKCDQCKTRSVWRSLKQSQKFSDVRAFVVNGRGCYYSSPFQRFYENPIQASNSQAYDPSPFQRFTGTFYRRDNYSLPIYPGKYSQRLVILRALTLTPTLTLALGVTLTPKHFIFFISPIFLKLEKEENDPMIGRRRVMFSVSSQCVKTTTIDSH